MIPPCGFTREAICSWLYAHYCNGWLGIKRMTHDYNIQIVFNPKLTEQAGKQINTLQH